MRISSHCFPLLLVIFMLTHSGLSAQDYESVILGTWVTYQTVPQKLIESPKVSPYFSYTFLPDNTFFYASNEYERGERRTYSIKGEFIKMFNYDYRLQLTNDKDELQLILELPGASGGQPYFVMLVRKEKYDSLWMQYNTTGQLSPPVFKGNYHLYDYFFSEALTPTEFEKQNTLITLHHNPPQKDTCIKVSIRIDSVGTVEVDSVSSDKAMGRRRIENIKKKLNNTSGLWAPATFNGINRTTEINLTFVQRGEVYFRFRSKATSLYDRSATAFNNKDYHAAMLYITNALTLTPDNFAFYVLRAACHLQLQDADKYCKDLMTAYTLNPLVSLTNIVTVNDETVEISCARASAE